MRALQICAAAACLAATVSVACSGTSPAKEAKYLESGKKYLEAKDYARAILQLKNAARSKPSDPEPQYQLGLAYLGSGDPTAAVRHLVKASELDSKHVPAQLKLAELMSLSQSAYTVREAEKRAQTVLDISPEDPDALSTLAVAELRLGKSDDATEHLHQALEKFPQHLKSSVALASIKLRNKDMNGAEQVLRQAVEQAPQSAEASVALGTLYLLMEKLPAAEAQLQRALQIDPKNAMALLDLGALQSRAGRRADADETYRSLAALPEKKYKPLHAMFLFQDGKHDAAIQEFEKLAKQDPTDRMARTRLVSALVAVKRVGDAEKVLNSALKENPKDTEALLQRSEIHLMAGKYNEAQSGLHELLRYRPDSAEARYFLSRVHQARGALRNQRQELSEALRLNPTFLVARVELARSLMAAKSAQAALDLLNQAPESQRNSNPVIAQRNWALLALGDRAESRKGIDAALAVARAPEFLLQDALLKLQAGEFSAARPELEEILDKNPADLRALETLARSYAAQKQPLQAIEVLRKYAAAVPKAVAVQHLLGKWLLAVNNPADARKAFLAAKETDPNFVAADLSLAQLDVSEGKLDAARQALTPLASAAPPNVAARLMLGMVEELAGNYAAAIEHYEKVVETTPDNALALNNLAYRLANDTNRLDEGLKLAQKAKELAPDNAAVDDTLGWALYRKGMYQVALPYLENAAQKGTGAVMKYHLAMLYVRLGDRKRGQQTLDAALKINPNAPESKMARQLLAEAAGKAVE